MVPRELLTHPIPQKPSCRLGTAAAALCIVQATLWASEATAAVHFAGSGTLCCAPWLLDFLKPPMLFFLETHNCACTFWGNWWWGGRDGRDYVHIYDKLNRGPIVVNHCKPTWLIMGNHRIEQCDSSAQKQRREENKDWDLTGYLGLSWNVLWGFKQKFHGDILWGCIADDCSWDS